MGGWSECILLVKSLFFQQRQLFGVSSYLEARKAVMEVIPKSRVSIRIDSSVPAECLAGRLLYLCLCLESAASPGT